MRHSHVGRNHDLVSQSTNISASIIEKVSHFSQLSPKFTNIRPCKIMLKYIVAIVFM